MHASAPQPRRQPKTTRVSKITPGIEGPLGLSYRRKLDMKRDDSRDAPEHCCWAQVQLILESTDIPGPSQGEREALGEVALDFSFSRFSCQSSKLIYQILVTQQDGETVGHSLASSLAAFTPLSVNLIPLPSNHSVGALSCPPPLLISLIWNHPFHSGNMST
jgi:hypothetical protein